jgi:DNA ligase (NAD+)
MCKHVRMFERVIILCGICCLCFGAPEQVERHAGQIRIVLEEASEAYYDGEPIMGNAAYDALRAQYEKLCAEYPDIPKLADVGAAVPQSSNRIAHSRPVLSLNKAYSDEELLAFVARCGIDRIYCIEPKLDGVTVVLRYEKGAFVQALTRGDGKLGVNVTSAIAASGCVPLMLPDAPDVIEMRGELLLSFAAFDALNERRVREGQALLKSPRNSAAGTLRLRDLSEIANRRLQIRMFELITADAEPLTHSGALKWLSELGLPVVEDRAVAGSKVLSAVAEMNQQRAASEFPTDGVVVRLDDRDAFQRLGATARYPRGAIARKYETASVETTLLRIEWTRGDSGRLTPVAYFEPVEMEGATLSRASLHSLDHLRALDLMIGDRVNVVRSGGSIPEIIGRAAVARSGQEIPIPDPE